MQKLIKNKNKEDVSVRSLEFGQLGEIKPLNGVAEDYVGCVITRMYHGFVIVYSPNPKIEAFRTTFDDLCRFTVELLQDAEVVLSND